MTIKTPLINVANHVQLALTFTGRGCWIKCRKSREINLCRISVVGDSRLVLICRRFIIDWVYKIFEFQLDCIVREFLRRNRVKVCGMSPGGVLILDWLQANAPQAVARVQVVTEMVGFRLDWLVLEDSTKRTVFGLSIVGVTFLWVDFFLWNENCL